MQFLLTQNEFDTLLGKIESTKNENKDTIQKLCTLVCDHKPVIWKDWGDERWLEKPWGCIITAEKEHGDEWYCDLCPVQKECPYPCKRYSK